MIKWLVVSISQNFPSQNPFHGMMNPCIGMAWSYQFNQLTFGQLWRHTGHGSQEPCWASVQFLEPQVYSEPWCGREAVFHGKPYTCAVDVKKDLAACSAAGHSRTSPMFNMLPSANVNLSSSSWNTRFSATISKFSSWALSFCRLNLQFTYCQDVSTFHRLCWWNLWFAAEIFIILRLFYEVFRQPQIR